MNKENIKVTIPLSEYEQLTEELEAYKKNEVMIETVAEDYQGNHASTVITVYEKVGSAVSKLLINKGELQEEIDNNNKLNIKMLESREIRVKAKIYKDFSTLSVKQFRKWRKDYLRFGETVR